MKKSKTPRNMAIISAYNCDGTAIVENTMTLDDYYGSSCEVIDSTAYRVSRGIESICGLLYNSKGILFQEFMNRYGKDGTYLGATIKYDDGAVVEFKP